MLRRTKLAIALLAGSVAGQAVAQKQAPAPAGPATLIRSVTVFDGTRSLGRHDVLIRGDRIVAIDPRAKPAPDTRIVDGTGKTLLPGLIDAHVHAFQAGEDPLLFGVTTQLDMFSPPEVGKAAHDKMARHDNARAADLYSAGYLATVPKGHGTEYGLPVPTLTTPAEADAWVAARVAEGSDYIKIVIEPGTTVGRPFPTLDAATVKALVVAAHKRGKLAVVHAQSLASATQAVEAGADGLAHLFSDQDGGVAFAALARKHGIFVVATYTVFEGFAGRSGTATLLDQPGLAGLLPKSTVDGLRRTMGKDRTAKLDAVYAANVTALAKAGVPVLAGTDAGNPATWYGISLHRELDLLGKAGLTPTQALAGATGATAKAFRLADRGRIAPGLKADLLLVDGDPTVNIGDVHKIAEIWKDGRSANDLRAARRAELVQAASAPAPAAATLPADGRIASFAVKDGKVAITAPFGSGWSASTDSIAGGKSSVALTPGGGAPNGQPSLVMTGTITSDFIAPWAGIGFNPGAQPFQPVNLAPARALRFWVRGEGKSLAVMGFSPATGRLPAVAQFAVGPEWREVTVSFADLKGFNPAEAMLLLITANQQPGPFKVEVADIRLVRE